ncbi:MAG: hypothetical protein ACRC7P_01965, partial [Enterovibrio sp.]
MMDQNRVLLSLSTQKNKVSAPKAEPADHKRAAEKAGNNKSDFSAHMKEKLAAADKKTAAKNAQSEPAAEK